MKCTDLRISLALLLFCALPGARTEVRRVIEVFEPFPFTRDGSRLQLQHAQQAVKRGSLSLAIVAKDGIVLAGECRLPSPLVVSSSKIGRVDKHLAYIMSGISADGRYLVKRARILAQKHWFEYGEPLGLSALLFELGKIITLGERRVKKDVRTFFDDVRSHPTIDPHADLETDLDKDPLPARHFGVGFLFAGYGEDPTASSEPPKAPSPNASLSSSSPPPPSATSSSPWCVYELEPTGIFLRWEARAIGEASERAEAMLNQEYRPGLSLAEAQRIAIHIMDAVLDVDPTTRRRQEPVEMSCLTLSRKAKGKGEEVVTLHRLSSEEIAALRSDVADHMGLTEAAKHEE